MSREERTRRNRVAVNLEDVIHDAFQALCDRENITNSEYIRSLILDDLLRKDLLPEITLHRLAGRR